MTDTPASQISIHARSPVTLKGSPSKDISISPQNFPSSISSSYLLQGPRVGSWVISGRQAGRRAGSEGWIEGGRVGVGREGGRRVQGRDREGAEGSEEGGRRRE